MMLKAGCWPIAAPFMGALIAAAPAHADPAHEAIELPGGNVFAENLDIDRDGSAYVGNVVGGVLKVSLKTGKASQWIKPGDFGTGSILGVLVDPVNKMVWLCSNDFSDAKINIAGADKGAHLKGFDLKTGKGKTSLKFPIDKAFCNDIAVSKDGTVYVTETNQSHIYRWKPGAAQLEDWLYDPALALNGKSGLDGIAFGGDGQLYVNNWQTNVIVRIAIKPDGSPGALTNLTLSRTPVMADGLRLIDGLQFAMAEGGGKVSLVTVRGDKAEVRPLAEDLKEATGVAVYEDAIWYSQGHMGVAFNPAARAQPLPASRITPVALPEDAGSK